MFSLTLACYSQNRSTPSENCAIFKLTKSVAITVANALVSSRIDYCNSLLKGVFFISNTKKYENKEKEILGEKNRDLKHIYTRVAFIRQCDNTIETGQCSKRVHTLRRIVHGKITYILYLNSKNFIK